MSDHSTDDDSITTALPAAYLVNFASDPDPGPGRFRCGMCGGTFDLGDDDEARAEAESHGLDVDDCGLVCDDCYRLTPWGMDQG